MRQFDLLGFAAHLVTLKHEVREHTQRGLEKALQLIETDAKQQIGEYQEAVGHFPAWAPLADSTEAEKARLGYPIGAPLLRTGDLRDSFGHEADGDSGIVGSTDPVMIYHEFGTSKMPPRPVLGPAVVKSEKKIEAILGRTLVEAVIEGEVIGLLSQGEL